MRIPFPPAFLHYIFIPGEGLERLASLLSSDGPRLLGLPRRPFLTPLYMSLCQCVGCPTPPQPGPLAPPRSDESTSYDFALLS